MPIRYNIDHQPQIVEHGKRAVMPGGMHNFTDEQVAAGLTGSWSAENPRKGLKAEKAFKERRDSVDSGTEDGSEDISDSPGEDGSVRPDEVPE